MHQAKCGLFCVNEGKYFRFSFFCFIQPKFISLAGELFFFSRKRSHVYTQWRRALQPFFSILLVIVQPVDARTTTKPVKHQTTVSAASSGHVGNISWKYNCKIIFQKFQTAFNAEKLIYPPNFTLPQHVKKLPQRQFYRPTRYVCHTPLQRESLGCSC